MMINSTPRNYETGWISEVKLDEKGEGELVLCAIGKKGARHEIHVGFDEYAVRSLLVKLRRAVDAMGEARTNRTNDTLAAFLPKEEPTQ